MRPRQKKIKVFFGYSGKLRQMYELTGSLIDETDDWLIVDDGSVNHIAKRRILWYVELD